MAGPLEGITILDWTQWELGTVAGAMLADLGATVIHIENRLTGDSGRVLNPRMWTLPNGGNAYFEVNNRGKKGITVDLKKEKGKELIYRLVKKADVFLHNNRQGVPEKLGMDYETLCRYNPKIVYAAASGYGPKGPEASEPAFDYVGMARSGMMHADGNIGGPPRSLVGGLADQMGGIMTAYGIMTALLVRERLGIGQKVDVSHLGSMMALQGLLVGISHLLYTPEEMEELAQQAAQAAQAAQDGQTEQPEPTEQPAQPPDARKYALNPLWNHYPCKDGTWIVLSMLQPDRQWPAVCKALGLEHMEKDPRFVDQVVRGENALEVINAFDEVFPSKTASEWMKVLKEAGDIICTPVQRISELANDPQVLANDYIIDYVHDTLGPVKVPGLPIALSKTPGVIKSEAPEFGQHTEEVLLELGGYDWEEIGQLREEEVI